MAITRRTSCNGSAGTASFSGTGGQIPQVGDLIIAFGSWNAAGTDTISDSLNGTYIQTGSFVDNNAIHTACFSVIVTVAGNPTLTLGGAGADRTVAGCYTGFVGSPTLLSGDFQYFNNPTGTTATSNTVTANTASVNNEFFIAALFHGNISTGFTTNSPFTNFDGSAQFASIADILAIDPSGISSGNTVQYSTSWTSGAVACCAISAGFYDKQSPPPVLMGAASL